MSAVVDGEVYYRENSVMVKPNLNATAKERVKGMAELRDCVHRLIDLQIWKSDDISIRAEQQKLNRLYDRFTEKYGSISGAPSPTTSTAATRSLPIRELERTKKNLEANLQKLLLHKQNVCH